GRAQRFLVVRRVVEILHIARLPREQAREYGRGRGGIDAAERVLDPASMLEGEPELRPDEGAQAGKLEPDGHITTSTEHPARRAQEIVDVRTILGEPALRRGRLPCLGCTGETRNEMPRMLAAQGALARLLEFLQRVFARRLQEAVARLGAADIGDDQRLVDQRRKGIQKLRLAGTLAR